MKKFGEIRLCPKCKHNGRSTAFKREDFKVYWLAECHSVDGLEKLRVSCPTCGYYWEEAPADKEEREE